MFNGESLYPEKGTRQGVSFIVGRKAKMASLENNRQFLTKRNILLPYSPTISSLVFTQMHQKFLPTHKPA